jgi:hypothetical protein
MNPCEPAAENGLVEAYNEKIGSAGNKHLTILLVKGVLLVKGSKYRVTTVHLELDGKEFPYSDPGCMRRHRTLLSHSPHPVTPYSWEQLIRHSGCGNGNGN